MGIEQARAYCLGLMDDAGENNRRLGQILSGFLDALAGPKFMSDKMGDLIEDVCQEYELKPQVGFALRKIFQFHIAEPDKDAYVSGSGDGTEKPKESPAFGVGDIVKIPKKGFVGQVGKLHYNEAGLCDCVSVRQTDTSVLVPPTDVELLFPLSRIPKELKLPIGEIRCEPRGTVIETTGGIFGVVVSIDTTNRCPIAVLCWHPKDVGTQLEFVNTHRTADEIERVVWRMEESK